MSEDILYYASDEGSTKALYIKLMKNSLKFIIGSFICEIHGHISLGNFFIIYNNNLIRLKGISF